MGPGAAYGFAPLAASAQHRDRIRLIRVGSISADPARAGGDKPGYDRPVLATSGCGLSGRARRTIGLRSRWITTSVQRPKEHCGHVSESVRQVLGRLQAAWSIRNSALAAACANDSDAADRRCLEAQVRSDRGPYRTDEAHVAVMTSGFRASQSSFLREGDMP